MTSRKNRKNIVTEPITYSSIGVQCDPQNYSILSPLNSHKEENEIKHVSVPLFRSQCNSHSSLSILESELKIEKSAYGNIVHFGQENYTPGKAESADTISRYEEKQEIVETTKKIKEIPKNIKSVNKDKNKKQRKIDIKETMRYLFNFDWYSNYNNLYDPGIFLYFYIAIIEQNFTPGVYWYYINTQYFYNFGYKYPKDNPTPDIYLSNIKQKLNEISKNEPLCENSDPLEMQYFAIKYLIKNNSEILKENNEKFNSKIKNLNIDKIIDDLNKDFLQIQASNSKIHSQICETIKAHYKMLSSKNSVELPKSQGNTLFRCNEYSKFQLENGLFPENTLTDKELMYLLKNDKKLRKIKENLRKRTKSELDKENSDSEEDEEIKCEICNSDDFTSVNPILKCQVFLLEIIIE